MSSAKQQRCRSSLAMAVLLSGPLVDLLLKILFSDFSTSHLCTATVLRS
jgi:hypothetical protein